MTDQTTTDARFMALSDLSEPGPQWSLLDKSAQTVAFSS